MDRTLAGFACACAAALSPVPAAAASFDCAKASSPAERSVCADASLSALDEHLGRYYGAARASLRDGAACLQEGQRRWLGRRDACSSAKACLEEAYLDRLAELDGLQPGATAIRGLELPARDSLVWVVPPAADKVAAPRNAKATPLEATGTILDEVAGGDGFVLRTSSGQRHLLVPLMFLDSATAAHLAALAREKQATYRASGHAISRDRRDFEPGRCVFIHRLATAARGQVFPDPGQAHPGFKPHQLAFATPRDGVARDEYRSVPFFAVILETTTPCGATESKRMAAQALFPAAKVFASRFGCDEAFEENIRYTNVDARHGFLAVFAGSSPTEADRVLQQVRASGRFPGANVRRMQAELVYP
jgi:uncharacterized protein